MKRVAAALCLVAVAVSATSSARPPASKDPANPEEIVVTAQRSGIPVWRVRGAAGTLVLVGTIEEVAKDTNWNPGSLAEALRGADQVMFPEDVRYTGGFFAVMSAPTKARRMERLPAGQTLAAYLTSEQL